MSQLISSHPLEQCISPYQARLLKFFNRHPEGFTRAAFTAFKPLAASPWVCQYLEKDGAIQPWPLLLDTARVAEIAHLTVQMCQLVQSVPERIFATDFARWCEFYHLNPELAPQLAALTALPWRPGGEVARGDFMLVNGVLQCIEVNAMVDLGGFHLRHIAEAHCSEPLLCQFYREENLVVRYLDPWRNFLRLIIERAVARGLPQQGRLDLALLPARLHHLMQACDLNPAAEYLQPSYQILLDELAPGISGKIFFCEIEELERQRDAVFLGRQPVQVIIDGQDTFLESLSALTTSAWLDGIIDLYPSPLSWAYRDKRNLALLSENLESSLFTPAEKALIAGHIPWTRDVIPGKTTYRGECVDLEKLLLDRQEDFVLKPTQMHRGKYVSVGKRVAREAWKELVQVAMKNPCFIVQECLVSDLQVHQQGTTGFKPCEIIWGLFAFGQRFGGNYLRLGPPNSDGITNFSHAADEAIFLEVLPQEQQRAHPAKSDCTVLQCRFGPVIDRPENT